MHDDRIPRWPLLGNEDPLNGGGIQRIGAQPVDSLRRQRHQSAAPQNLRRAVERFIRLDRLKHSRPKTVGVYHQPQGLHRIHCRRSERFCTTRRTPPAVYSLLTMPVETEIKFRTADPNAFCRKLEQAGFHLQTPRSFESNVLYDTPDRAMRARTEILRLRDYAGRCLLTHKRLPDAGPGEDRHKHRIETETLVSDGAALAQVFASLGLTPAFRYEKWRSEWEDGEGHCVVDETPIGDFAELEGPAEWIDRTAARLGIDPPQYITLSYGRLFEQWREQHGSAAQDLTFADIQAAEKLNTKG